MPDLGEYSGTEEQIREKYDRLVSELDKSDSDYLANRNELLVGRDVMLSRLWDKSRTETPDYAAIAALNAQITAANTRTILKLQIELHQEIARWKRMAPFAVGILLAAVLFMARDK